MDYETVQSDIIRRAGNPDIDALKASLAAAGKNLSDLKEEAISALTRSAAKEKDLFLQRKLDQIESLEVADPGTIERTLGNRGQTWSRDSTAVTQGFRLAPHQALVALTLSATVTENGLETLEKTSREAARHISRSTAGSPQPVGASAEITNPALFEQYDELAADVARSKHQFFQGNLKRWLDFLDGTAPFARLILQQLEANADFATWFAPYRVMAGGGGTARNVDWPTDMRKRLGTQILLFRRMATGDIEPGIFALTVLASGRNINEGTADIVNQIFLPMAKELRRYLLQDIGGAGQKPQKIPASDRTVTLDHNSEQYLATVKGLEDLVRAVETTNDYEDVDDKEERIAELTAGRQLLRAVRVRALAIWNVLRAPLLWLTEKFAGGIISELAKGVWHLAKGLFGF